MNGVRPVHDGERKTMDRDDAGQGRGTAERERLYAPPPPAQGQGFARTWWGRTWLQALEDTALDGKQLKRGRALARQGAVGAVSVRPGRITAVVPGSDRSPLRADVLLRELDADEWDRLLDVMVAQAGHIAALLDRDMPPRLVEDAADAGLDLLPGIGDLDAECACGAWDHCPHTAALSYQMARVLDEDPFALLLLRGRAEREVLEALQERSTARAARESSGGPGAGAPGTGAEPAGVDAAEAFVLGALLPPLPPQPAPVGEAPRVPALEGADSAGPGVDVEALELLAEDAAARAGRLLAAALSAEHADAAPPRTLTAWEDAVRFAATHPRAMLDRLAEGCGRGVEDLRRAVRAWRFGGAEALAVLEESWTPPPGAVERARDLLEDSWPQEEARPALRAAGTCWTAVGAEAQLRYGPDGRWWPFRRQRGAWWPVGRPERDAAVALAAALADDAEPHAGED